MITTDLSIVLTNYSKILEDNTFLSNLTESEEEAILTFEKDSILVVPLQMTDYNGDDEYNHVLYGIVRDKDIDMNILFNVIYKIRELLYKSLKEGDFINLKNASFSVDNISGINEYIKENTLKIMCDSMLYNLVYDYIKK